MIVLEVAAGVFIAGLARAFLLGYVCHRRHMNYLRQYNLPASHEPTVWKQMTNIY